MGCHQENKCKCGSPLDAYGDHCLGCKINHKTKASNDIRDEIIKVFQRILPIVIKMIDSLTQVETELHNVAPLLPCLKPLDLSIRLDHLLVGHKMLAKSIHKNWLGCNTHSLY
jgi:hypothetical protein